MKLFQLYPKALAHLTCKSPNRACRPKGPNLPRPRRTERPCGATGEAAGEKWSIFRWSRRTRRTTKGHEDCQCILEITVQAQRAKPSTAKDTKDQGALKRPGEQSVQAQSAKPSTATENRTRDKRATGEALCKDQASKPLNFQTSTKGAFVILLPEQPAEYTARRRGAPQGALAFYP